jgi:hypothetical protein
MGRRKPYRSAEQQSPDPQILLLSPERQAQCLQAYRVMRPSGWHTGQKMMPNQLKAQSIWLKCEDEANAASIRRQNEKIQESMDRVQREANERARQAAEEQAKREERARVDESTYQAAMAEMKDKMDKLGYDRMDVTNFALDARQLKERGAKVSVMGRYRVENGELLEDRNAQVCLLTSDAPRGLRRFLLTQASPIGPFNELIIPDVVIMGTAVADQQGHICLAAENGWSLQRPGIAFGSYVPRDLRDAQ